MICASGGVVLLPELNKEEKLNIGISQRKIAALLLMRWKERSDRCVRVICLSRFIDSHMHDEEKEDGDMIEKLCSDRESRPR